MAVGLPVKIAQMWLGRLAPVFFISTGARRPSHLQMKFPIARRACIFAHKKSPPNSAGLSNDSMQSHQSPLYGIKAMKRARLIDAVTACWLIAVQPVLRRPTILPWRLVSFFNSSTSL